MNKIIEKCIDMDEWKHSWHNELKTSADFIKAHEVIRSRIAEREIQILELERGLLATKNKIRQCKEYEDLEKQDDV